MLAALARAGHGVELAEIHRFSQPWERQASLALRHGKAEALAAYRTAGRLHPCQDGDAALDGVFAHWAAARAEGQDALMLARTRQDVDALNLRARAAALAAGQVTGPVTEVGGREWQAGDVLRARRNDRRLIVGDGHVRNGDRYQVLGPGPQDGLIVADLTGRGRTVLPAAYLAEHAEYGWASTIDAAQGATADLGIVLVRPGMDREHLYVAMTRGRHGNHAYITPDPTSTDDDNHHDHGHGHPHKRHSAHTDADPQEQAVRVLEAALGRSGAQDAAHTALEHARTHAQAQALAAHTARQNQRAAEQAAERAAAREVAAREAAAAQRERRQTRPLLPEHARVVQQLQQCQVEREQLHRPRRAAPRPAAEPPGARGVAPVGPRAPPCPDRHDAQQRAGAAAQRADCGHSGRRGRPAHPSGRPPHPAAPDQRPVRAAPLAPGPVGPGPCRRAGPALAGAGRRPRPDHPRPARRARALPRRRA